MSVQYRRLTLKELEEMEKEFVDFLVVNGITADDWVSIKNNDSPKAEDLISIFSNLVFETIFKNVRFLDFSSTNEMYAFQCLEDQMVLVGIECHDEEIDLREPGILHQFGSKVPASAKIIQHQKSYQKKREIELFELVEKGATISKEGTLFKRLSLLYAST